MWVVKLGGSLFNSLQLTAWLAVCVQYGAGRVVIVPGGGPFADQVRHAQSVWRFGDETAHRMAVRGMEQYGLMLAGMQHNLIPATTQVEIEQILNHAQVAVWLPSQLVDADREITKSWNLTSDALAAWLSKRISAKRLVLVKSMTIPETGLSVSSLQRRGFIDNAFATFVAGVDVSIHIVNRDQHALFGVALRRDSSPGIKVYR